MLLPKQLKQETLIHLPLPAILHLQQTLDGLGPLQELPPSPLLQLTLLVAQVPRGSSHSPLVLVHRANTQGLLQHLAVSPQAPGYLDNILHQGLLGSFPPALEPQDNSLGSTHLKEPQDSYPEDLVLTQLDRFPLAQGLPLGPILMCLTRVVSQEEAMGCMVQEVQVHSPLQPALALSLHSLLEDFPQYPQDHGDHLQVVASLLPLAPLALVLGPWVHMVVLQLQEAC